MQVDVCYILLFEPIKLEERNMALLTHICCQGSFVPIFHGVHIDCTMAVSLFLLGFGIQSPIRSGFAWARLGVQDRGTTWQHA